MNCPDKRANKRCKHKNSYSHGRCSFAKICDKDNYEMFEPTLRTRFIQWLKGAK